MHDLVYMKEQTWAARKRISAMRSAVPQCKYTAVQSRAAASGGVLAGKRPPLCNPISYAGEIINPSLPL